MYGFFLHVCVQHIYAGRGHWIPGAGVTDGCEPLYGSWKLNLGPLEEQ